MLEAGLREGTVTEQRAEGPTRPDAVETDIAGTEAILQPAKLLRIASMTRAMLEEVRQAPLDEAGRRRLHDVYDRSLGELREVLSEDLQEELDEIFLPLADDSAPTQADLQVAQAQLIGWLEGLFHGIQATLFSQQLATQAQLEEMRRRRALEPGSSDRQQGRGAYL